jgi:chemotaxis protein CheX
MTETIRMPERLDLSTVGPFADALRQRMGADLSLDATGLNHVGGLGAQVLLSAAASWRATGQNLTLTGLSEDVQTQFAELGLSPEALQVREGSHVD